MVGFSRASCPQNGWPKRKAAKAKVQILKILQETRYSSTCRIKRFELESSK